MRVIASIDDGSKLDLQAAELMDKYGVQCIFYVPVRYTYVNHIKGREPLSDQDFKDLASRFEIGSHTITHPLLTRIDSDLAQYEIGHSRALLQEMTGQEINSFCYPRGYYSYQLKQFVEEAGYTSARTVQVGHLTEPQDPYLTHTTVHVGYNRKEYGGLPWLDYGLKMLREAKENSVYHLWGHSWELQVNRAWGDLEFLLKAVTA